jgi:hypothetical protein
VIVQGVAFEEIDESHLLALVENGYAERRTVEYKRDLPTRKDDDKKEFLADVSSLANASGGDLVFGVEAVEGVPTRLAPLAISPDAEKLAWEASIRDGIDPRIPSVRVREIVVEGGHVLIFRIPRSWVGPHVVTYKGAFRFYSRTSAGKYPLDVGELRTAFLGGNRLADELRSFRAGRLGLIVAGEAPVQLASNPKVIVHVLPFEAFVGRPSVQLNDTEGTGLFRPLFRNYTSRTRWNIDGLLTAELLRDDEPSTAYAQLFRNGAFEGVDAGMMSRDLHQQYRAPYLYGHWLEYALNGEFANSLEVLRRVGAQPPMAILVTVIGVKGYIMLAGEGFFEQGRRKIDRDTLVLPDVVLEAHISESRDQLPRLMRPVIDAFWQAGGWPGSTSYQADGTWNPPR